MEDDSKAAATLFFPKKHTTSLSSKFSPRTVTTVAPAGGPTDGFNRRISGGGRNEKATLLCETST